jgi:ppGpp synthetase/RelA/SpoT-type nucleotidyltranferase
MAPPLSRSAIDALGKRLARAVVADSVDLQQLFALQRESIEALEQTLKAIAETVQNDPPRGDPVHVTHRVKTVETLIDKLRRGTALSRMQDLVGLRVVGDFGLSGQDELVGRLVHRFPGARVDDRRVRPSHGYRAVHVIPKIGGFSVEVQVRTSLQHAWANATEQLADQWGRAIRYGGSPTGANDEEITRRVRALFHWIEASKCIGEIEAAGEAMATELTTRVFGALMDEPGASTSNLVERILSSDPSVKRGVDEAGRKLHSVLRAGGLEISLALQAELDRGLRRN